SSAAFLYCSHTKLLIAEIIVIPPIFSYTLRFCLYSIVLDSLSIMLTIVVVFPIPQPAATTTIGDSGVGSISDDLTIFSETFLVMSRIYGIRLVSRPTTVLAVIVFLIF